MENRAITSSISAIDVPPRLIPACLEGDAAAREKMARWCLPKIRRTVLLTYGNGPDADDLVQTAVVRVFDPSTGIAADPCEDIVEELNLCWDEFASTGLDPERCIMLEESLADCAG